MLLSDRQKADIEAAKKKENEVVDYFECNNCGFIQSEHLLVCKNNKPSCYNCKSPYPKPKTIKFE